MEGISGVTSPAMNMAGYQQVMPSGLNMQGMLAGQDVQSLGGPGKVENVNSVSGINKVNGAVGLEEMGGITKVSAGMDIQSKMGSETSITRRVTGINAGEQAFNQTLIAKLLLAILEAFLGKKADKLRKLIEQNSLMSPMRGNNYGNSYYFAESVQQLSEEISEELSIDIDFDAISQVGAALDSSCAGFYTSTGSMADGGGAGGGIGGVGGVGGAVDVSAG